MNFGARFSRNADIPSALSAVEKLSANASVSKRQPFCKSISLPALMAALACRIATGGLPANVRAKVLASSRHAATGTTRLTKPYRSAVSASIMSPV